MDGNSSDEGVFGQFTVCKAAHVGLLNVSLYSPENRAVKGFTSNNGVFRRVLHCFVIHSVEKFYVKARFNS